MKRFRYLDEVNYINYVIDKILITTLIFYLGLVLRPSFFEFYLHKCWPETLNLIISNQIAYFKSR